MTGEILDGLGLLWNSTQSLPFLPSSALTIPDYGRRALAQATLTLWEALGIDTSPENIAAWINSREHSFIGSRVDYANLYMSELIHYTYFVVAEEDIVTFMAIWSVTLFDQTSNPILDVRDYSWLLVVLTPAEAHFYEAAENLDWENGSMDYEEFDPSLGYNTFGSTELESFSDTDRERFISEMSRGLFWEHDVSAGDVSIYIMSRHSSTVCKLSNAETLV